MLCETVGDTPESALEGSLTQQNWLIGQHTAALQHALAESEEKRRLLERAVVDHEQARQQLEAELEDAQLLHGISAMLIDEDTIDQLYQCLVDAATRIMRSDFGSMQRFDPVRGELQLIAHHGLNDEALAYWQWVYAGRATTCGRALQLGQRVIVPDFERCGFIAGSEDLLEFRKAGVKAAQSTPLLTRSGKLVGMITTHWTREHQPQERELRLLDIVARQAADLFERNAVVDSLRQQSERLVEADRYKNEFLATLAHELRNPLAPLQTGVAVIKIGKPEQAARVLPMMERQLGHMVHLIDDLLDVSRISRGMVTLKRARIELSAVIDSAVETSRPLIVAAGHKFTLTMPGTVIWLDADLTRVAQIISNLLNNAAKYTPPGGQIELVAEAADGQVAISVIDNGIGIPAVMLPKIFELFTQVDGGAARSQGGLGVGLALARQLAEMHEGDLQVESPRGQGGSSFTLRLPVAEALPQPAHDRDALLRKPLPAQVARVLIVDDNVDAAETLAMLLQEFGHITSVVVDSTAALAEAIAFCPDVAFLDIGMPRLDGFDLARLLRAEPALRHVRLAALSGWGTEDDRLKSQQAGIDHHLTKPVLLADVTAILDSATAQR